MFFIASAYAQAAPAAPQPQPGGGFQFFILIAMLVFMYFLMIRPQQKRAKEQRALLDSLKKGDEIMTNSGLMGRIVALDETAVDLEIAKNTVVRLQRGFIVAILPKGTLKQALKEKDSKDESGAKAVLAKEEAPADDAQS